MNFLLGSGQAPATDDPGTTSLLSSAFTMLCSDNNAEARRGKPHSSPFFRADAGCGVRYMMEEAGVETDRQRWSGA